MFDFGSDDSPTTPLGVKVSAALVGLLGVAQLGVGGWLLITASQPWDGGIGPIPLLGGFLAVFGIVSGGLGVWAIATARGIVRRQEWARVAALAIGCLLLVPGLLYGLALAASLRAVSARRQIPWGLVGLVAFHLAAGTWQVVWINLRQTRVWFRPAVNAEAEASAFLEAMEKADSSTVLRNDEDNQAAG